MSDDSAAVWRDLFNSSRLFRVELLASVLVLLRLIDELMSIGSWDESECVDSRRSMAGVWDLELRVVCCLQVSFQSRLGLCCWQFATPRSDMILLEIL